MSTLTFNGKMNSCALQTGKTNKPGESSPQPGASRALSTFLHWGRLSVGATQHPRNGETHFWLVLQVSLCPRNSLALPSLKRFVFIVFISLYICELGSQVNSSKEDP